MDESLANANLPTNDASSEGREIDFIGSSSPSPNATAETEDQTSSEGLETKKLKSVVWSHFVKKMVNGEEKAECKYCNKLLVGASKNGTSHLSKHHKRCPRRVMPDIRQQILINNLHKKEMTSYVFDQDVVRKELASMIMMHEYPISMVEHVGFKRFSLALQPMFKVPSRNTVKSDIFKIFEGEKGKMMKILEQNDSRVAVTTDMWTSSNKKRGFMAVTAHFIDGTWSIQRRILR